MYRKVLLVEDDNEVRDSVKAVLEEAGFQVATAANGLIGLDVLREDPRISVIILDLFLPELNGWEFRTLQWKDPSIASIPLIICSSVWTLEQTSELLQASGYLQKPFEANALIEMIHRVSGS